MARDDFPATTKDALAKRVALRCSNPTCRATTAGPHSLSTQFVNVGAACHITAASSGGPRFDATLTQAERSSIDNAIWLCQTCAKLIDSDPLKFTAGILNTWKIDAEASTFREVTGIDGHGFYPQPVGAIHTPVPQIFGLPYDDARDRLMRAGGLAGDSTALALHK